MSSALLAATSRRLFGTGNPYTSGLGSELRLDERRNKARHGGVEVTRAAHEVNGRQFRLSLQGKIGLDPGAQRFARQIDAQDADHRDSGSGGDTVPIHVAS